MNRIDRIAAILIQMQSKSFTTANEIAMRFDISKRTVYRDIKALEEAGVPVGAEPGRGYFIVDGYHLPPVMFTKEEASSLIVAAKLVAKHADESIHKDYTSALFKIRSVLKNSDRAFLERIDKNVGVLAFSLRDKNFPDNFISAILQAVANNQLIEIDYLSISKNQLIPKRKIEPLGIVHYSMRWHLIAYCRLRYDYRDFRVDRIKSLKMLDEKFYRKEKFTIDKYFEQLFYTEELIPIFVRFHKSIAKNIQHTRYYYGFINEKVDREQDFVVMKFAVNEIEYFAKWLLTLGTSLEIISPETLKMKIVQLSRQLAENYL